MVETTTIPTATTNPLSNLKIKRKDKDDKIKSKIKNKELKDKLKFKEKPDKIKLKYKDATDKLKYKEKPDKIKLEDDLSKTVIRIKKSKTGGVSVKSKIEGATRYFMLDDFTMPQMSVLLNDPNICPPLVAQKFFGLLTQARTTQEVRYVKFFERVKAKFMPHKEATVV